MRSVNEINLKQRGAFGKAAAVIVLSEEGPLLKRARKLFVIYQADENETALALLPELLKDIDGTEDKGARFETVVKGVFAGNIFDLGAGKVGWPPYLASLVRCGGLYLAYS